MKTFQKLGGILLVIIIAITYFLVVQNLNIVAEGFLYIVDIMFPLLLGGAMAFVINVPMRGIEAGWFKKWKIKNIIKRVIAFVITLIGILTIVAVVVIIVVPELADTCKIIIDVQFPNAIKAYNEVMLPLFQKYLPLVQLEKFDWELIVKQIVEFVQKFGTGLFVNTASIVGGIFSGVTTVFIAFIFAIYILFQKENLARQFKKAGYAFIKTEKMNKVVDVLKLSNRVFSDFLAGQCVEAVILGAMFFVSMAIFKMDYPLLIAVLIGICSLIPMFGAFIGLGIGVFLIVIVDPIQAVWFTILFFVLQQIENNLIYPNVVGNNVGLPSIWVLIAVTLGGRMFGVLGMLLFIPIFSVAYSIFKEVAHRKLKEKNIVVNVNAEFSALKKEDDKSKINKE